MPQRKKIIGNSYVKADIMKDVAKKTGVRPETVGLVMDAIFFSIKKNVLDYKNVWIRDFGRFELKKYAARRRQNVYANKAVMVPEHYQFFYYPNLQLKKKTKTVKVKQDIIPGLDEKIPLTDLDAEDLGIFDEASSEIFIPETDVSDNINIANEPSSPDEDPAEDLGF